MAYDVVVWRHWLSFSPECLQSSRSLGPRTKKTIEIGYAMDERAQIAMAVASMYPGGDYFEFGSAGFRTLKTFLTAFDLNDRAINSPETKFFAFDVFGKVDDGRGVPKGEEWYYEHYRGKPDVYADDYRRLQDHGLLLDRCEIVRGYFEDTLNEAFRKRLRDERRTVGFAYLDCNISSSYKTCFAFLLDFIRIDRAFVYMDEYYCTQGVPEMFDEFCATLRERHRLRAHFVRNAGVFGALFCLMHNPSSC